MRLRNMIGPGLPAGLLGAALVWASASGCRAQTTELVSAAALRVEYAQPIRVNAFTAALDVALDPAGKDVPAKPRVRR